MLRFVSLVLLACVALLYAILLAEGREARARVVDTTAYGALLAADGHDPINSIFDQTNGSASIGINYRFPASVGWTIPPLAKNTSARRWLYIMGDQPAFFAPSGSIDVTVGSAVAGTIHAIAAKAGSSFLADAPSLPIVIPPAQTYGYRFPIVDGSVCSDTPCDVSIRANWAFLARRPNLNRRRESTIRCGRRSVTRAQQTARDNSYDRARRILCVSFHARTARRR